MTSESATNSHALTWLRVLRLALGMSLYDFAKRCRLSPARISLIERRGLAEAEPYDVHRLTQALGTSSREIAEALMARVDPDVLMRLARQGFSLHGYGTQEKGR